MRNFYGYIRVSTARQGEHGVSLEQQKAAITNYAERNNLQLTRWFEEQETAAKRGRPIFGRMLKLLKSGHASGVVIHKIDRSARNLRDWADLGELIDQGIAVHFANEALDLNSRGGRLAADIQAIISADFIRNLRDETKKGFYGRLKQGLYPRPAPPGYLNSGKGKPKTIDRDTAPHIRTAFELYATGRFSLRTLTKEMNDQGMRGAGGKRLSINGMSKILNNPFYTGTIVIKKTNETYAGIHEPIISQTLYDNVQKLLHSKVGRKLIKHQMLFSRMFHCQRCGSYLVGEIQKGNNYYRCHSVGCKTSTRESTIELALLRQLKKLEYTQEEKDYFRDRILELKRDLGNQEKQTIQGLELQLTQADERLNRLTDAYIDRLIDKESFERRKTTLLAERRSTQERLADVKTNPLTLIERLSYFLEFAGNTYIAYRSGTIEEKRELVNIVTSNREVNRKSVKIMLETPFDMVSDRLSVPGGSPSRGTPRTWTRVIYRVLRFVQSMKPSNLEEEHAM